MKKIILNKNLLDIFFKTRLPVMNFIINYITSAQAILIYKFPSSQLT